MKRLHAFVAWMMLVGVAGTVWGQGTAPAGPPSLEGVKWNGPAPSLESLKGKTVLVLVYATWCPICNKWSPEFFKQLHAAIEGKPVVVLAIDADSSPEGVPQYLAERSFYAPNILHGYDPAIHKRLGFESNLYQYIWIDADGKPTARGSAGMYHQSPKGQEFTLASEIVTRPNLGQFKVLDAQMSPQVQTALWPVELGDFSETGVTKAKAALNTAQKKEVDAAVEKLLDARLADIRELYKGSLTERLQAHEKGAALACVFKATSQSKKAKEVVAFLEKDEQFKRELAAKKAYDACAQKIAATPKSRAALLKGLAQRFEGTEYGNRAKEEAAKKM